MKEIVWFGRGGQGAKTASAIFAEVMFNCGYYTQSFPDYGLRKIRTALCVHLIEYLKIK